MLWRWRAMLAATVSEELAHGAGIDPARERLVMTLALAITVAVALRVVGALLIAAMLIVPAATARVMARSPEGMAALALAVGSGAVLAGLWLSMTLDTPAGPSIVAAAATGFAGALAGAGVLRLVRAGR